MDSELKYAPEISVYAARMIHDRTTYYVTIDGEISQYIITEITLITGAILSVWPSVFRDGVDHNLDVIKDIATTLEEGIDQIREDMFHGQSW